MLTTLLSSTDCSQKRAQTEIEVTKEIAKEAKNMVLAKRHLIEFIRQAWHIVEPKTPFVDGWHLHAVCDHLEAISRNEIQNLLINIPPRHSKSLIVSVFFPAWEWLQNPSHRYVYASYAESLSKRDSRKCRRLIQSLWYQSRWGGMFHISSDQNEKMRFENNKTGLRLATSVGGKGTGEGGSRIVCIPAGYFINTECGEIDICRIVVDRLSLKVLSYNHELQTTEFKEIEEYETSLSEEIIEIDLGNGEIIESTPDHLICIEGQGYKKAEDLKSGDVVLYERQLINA